MNYPCSNSLGLWPIISHDIFQFWRKSKLNRSSAKFRQIRHSRRICRIRQNRRFVGTPFSSTIALRWNFVKFAVLTVIFIFGEFSSKLPNSPLRVFLDISRSPNIPSGLFGSKPTESAVYCLNSSILIMYMYSPSFNCTSLVSISISLTAVINRINSIPNKVSVGDVLPSEVHCILKSHTQIG